MKGINKLQQAFLLSREFARNEKTNESYRLMVISQTDLIQGFLDYINEYTDFYKGKNADYIMNYSNSELRDKFTNLALKTTFNI